MGQFDIERFAAVYESFSNEYDDESDKSGGQGTRRVFKETGSDLLDAAIGHDEWKALHSAIRNFDRGEVGRIASRILSTSAAA